MGMDGLARALTAGLRPDLRMRRCDRPRERRREPDPDAKVAQELPIFSSHDPACFVCVTGAMAAPIPPAVALPIAWMTAAVWAFCPTSTAMTATVRSAVKAARKVPLIPFISLAFDRGA